MTLESNLKVLYEAIDQLPRPYEFQEIERQVLRIPIFERRQRRDQLIQERTDKFTAEKKPYYVDNSDRHDERCNRCGDEFTAGYGTIVNPTLNDLIVVPNAALHSMKKHGTTDYDGSEYQGSINEDFLRRVLGLADLEYGLEDLHPDVSGIQPPHQPNS